MRKDGRVIHDVDPLYRIIPHFMVERNDALNSIKEYIPSAPVQQFINTRRKEGKKYSHLAIYLASIVRTINEYPYLNRFVVNRKIYARNEITIGMVVLKPGEAHGTMNKMYFKPDATLDEVQETIDKYINENRQQGQTNSTDKIVNTLLNLPGLCTAAVKILRWADKHGLLPKAVLDASPFHCSVVFTNLASIRTNYIYHHAYNFGTVSMVMALGQQENIPKISKGEMILEKNFPVGIVMDERIADGCEFTIAFQYMQKLFRNPELLELRPEKINRDVD